VGLCTGVSLLSYSYMTCTGTSYQTHPRSSVGAQKCILPACWNRNSHGTINSGIILIQVFLPSPRSWMAYSSFILETCSLQRGISGCRVL